MTTANHNLKSSIGWVFGMALAVPAGTLACSGDVTSPAGGALSPTAGPTTAAPPGVPPNTGAGPGAAGGDSLGGAGGAAAPTCSFTRARKVYHGTLEPTEVKLREDSVVAIGKLDLGGGLCSGTLVTRDWVLTAAHCTGGSTDEMRFSIGRDPANPDMEYRVTEKRESPDRFDTALLKLDRSPLDDDPAIVPIQMGFESLDSSMGKKMEAAGYGQTEKGTTGTRFFTAEPVVRLEDKFISVDGEGERGVCGGDSGGPLMTTYEDGSVRVIADLTGGDPSCVGVDQFTRLDNQRDWIISVVGEPDPCAGLTPVGRCDGQTARWCEGDAPQSQDCMETEEVCGADMDGNSRCVEDRSCGDVTLEGQCDGTIATWCEDDLKQTQDCSEVPGQLCGFDSNAPGNRCVADPCQGVSEQGECQGNTARACIDGELQEVDCTMCAQSCAVDAVSGAGCVAQ